MESFLGHVADHILQNYGDKPDRLTVVFPNKRAGLYLKKELASRLTKTSWLPHITTIEEAISDWTGTNLADPLKLRFDLMEIHLELHTDNNISMVDFGTWAEQFMRDFDEIDHYMVDAAKLFDYLTEAKAIELWHPDRSPLSTYEKNYLAFYRSLIHYYNILKERLKATNTAYPGMLYRSLATDKTQDLLKQIPTENILFAGFNALSPAESSLITSLLDSGKAEILWNLDQYYYNENRFGQHEAGHFARRFFKQRPQTTSRWISNKLLETEKKITLTAVPGHVLQVKAFAHSLTKSLPDNAFEAEKTALVLADESLLSPVINSIPDQAGSFNITMGLPFHYSPVYQFIQMVFDMHLGASINRETYEFQTKALLKLLGHTLWAVLLDSKELQQLSELKTGLLSSGRLYVSKENSIEKITEKHLYSFISKMLSPWQQKLAIAFQGLDALLNEMASLLMRQAEVYANILLLNHLSAAGRIITRLQSLLQNKDHLMNLKGLRKLFVQLAPSVGVSLYGEPLQGLQIMGLLETRNLSFERVYLLSANEGILPGTKHSQSLIPYDIRRHFGLPSHFEKQAVYAYNFFSLLKDSSEMHIFYNSEPDRLGGGEKSRYLLQIEHELCRLNPKISLTQSVFTFPLKTAMAPVEIKVEKGEGLMQLLEAKARTGFSPTSLASFINCPLRFLLNDLLKIENPDELNESIGMDVLGTVVHESLYKLYKPYLKNTLNRGIFRKMQANAENILQQTFKEEYPNGETTFGKNRLIAEVAGKFVEQFLLYEAREVAEAEVLLLGLETRLEHILQINGRSIVLKGTADRIDRRNGTTHIIDYKTGSVSKSDLSCTEWEELVTDGNKAKALQLMIYSYLYLKNNQGIDASQIEGNIISLRKLSDGMMAAKFPDEGFDVAKAEGVLNAILQNIFDPDQPFGQTSQIATCRYCDFKDMCQRHND
jgi:ATP-dependent helicase/nuclease subunit B